MQLFDIQNYTAQLIEKDGIYHSTNESEISYPKDGNKSCFDLEENSYWFNHRNNCIIEVAKKYCTENCFFDIGGGNGFVSKGLQKNGFNSVLLEPGIQGCMNAKERGVENVICSTLEDAAFKKESIASIGLFDVIEHIKDDRSFIKSIYSYLQPNGMLIISVPAYKMLWSDEDDEAGHYRRYTVGSIKNLLVNNEFDVLYSSYFFSFLVMPLFLIRTIPSLFKIRKKSKTKVQNEHTQNKGIIGKIMDSIWEWEIKRIANQKSIPFGTSCLIVAKKK